MRVELNRPLNAAASRRDERTGKTTGRSFADMYPAAEPGELRVNLGETGAPRGIHLLANRAR